MKEKVLETDEILKGSKSTTDAGEKGSICEEPKHQKLKLLVAELPTLDDSPTQDCREYERSLSDERFEMGMMELLCDNREREKKEMLKRMLELECELDAKKMRIEELTAKLEENFDEIDGLQGLIEQLFTKERLGNNELQNARKALIEGSSDLLSSNRVSIGIKRMGELDMKPFKNACKTRFPSDEAEIKAIELCSLWQESLQDSEWYPFQIIKDEKGNPKILLKEEDERLCSLKNEWGTEVYEAVTSALTELREYNPSGCYVVPELWNFKENRKATSKEGILYIFGLLKNLKRKRN